MTRMLCKTKNVFLYTKFHIRNIFVFVEKFKSDPRVEDIKLIQGTVCLENTALEDDDERTEKVQEEEGDEESDDIEERKFPLPHVQNKFSLLDEDE